MPHNFQFSIFNFQKKNSTTGLMIIILLSFIPLLDFLHPGLPITHDGQDHVARIANFYKSLMEGNLTPRWAANLNWGYGHPILMFLYPLPSYLASFFHIAGFSFTDSLKAVFGITYIISGIGMYLWIRKFLGNAPGIIAGILYIFAPYRFVDLYVRGAIGEHVAFVFLPFILYFLLKLSEKYTWRDFILGCFSIAGLLLSHNALSVMFLPFIFLYGIYLVSMSRNKKMLTFIYIGIFTLGFGLSSFFLLPAFFEGKYTLRDIVTSGEYSSRFVNLKDLIYGQWSFGGTGQFTVQLGIINWALIIFSLILILTTKKNTKKSIYFISFSYLILSCFLMLKDSDFIWKTFTVLQKFQFPWRFLSASIFSASILGAYCIYLVPGKLQKLFIVLFLVLTLYLNKEYFHANGYIQKPDEFYSGIYNGTTDTGESSPIWSIRFMEKKPLKTVEVISGSATISPISRTSTKHIYTINSFSKSRIRENTLYLPGWKVFVNGSNKPVEFQDPANRGLITFIAEKGKNSVVVEFQDTKLRKISNIITLISLSIIILIGIKKLFIKVR